MKNRTHNLFAKYDPKTALGMHHPVKFLYLMYTREDWQGVMVLQEGRLAYHGNQKVKEHTRKAKKKQGRSGVLYPSFGPPLSISGDVATAIDFLDAWWNYQPYACGGIAVVRSNVTDIADLPISPCAENLVWITSDDLPKTAPMVERFVDDDGFPLQVLFGVVGEKDGYAGDPVWNPFDEVIKGFPLYRPMSYEKVKFTSL
jgi:hypothetical protein